jgi:hypothetical protein
LERLAGGDGGRGRESPLTINALFWCNSSAGINIIDHPFGVHIFHDILFDSILW